VIATFADYMTAGPLLIATDHRGTADGKPIRIFFSNLWDQINGSTRKPSEGFIRTADDEAYKSGDCRL
jgi:hypothetical protein